MRVLGITMTAALLLSGCATTKNWGATGKDVLPNDQCPDLQHCVTFDAANIREGRFTYQISLKDEKLGLAIIEVRRQAAGDYLIVFDSEEIGQHWMSSFERRFNPVSAELDMSSGKGRYKMELRYSGTKVSGMEFTQGAARTVEAQLQKQTVDQRVDWAAMMAAKISDGGSIEFEVYDPGTTFSRLVGRRSESQPVTSVLGEIATIRLDYTIHKKNHTEEYSAYATRAEPRVMLREEMPGGLVSVLVALEE